jgi:hypothetical protein
MITFTIPAFVLILFTSFLIGVILTAWVLMFKLKG